VYSRDRALASETRFQTHSQFQHSEFSWRRRWNRQRQRQWNFFTFPPVFPVLSWATGLAEFRKNWYKEGLKWTRIITTWRKFFKTHDRFDCQGDLRTRRGGPEDPEGGTWGPGGGTWGQKKLYCFLLLISFRWVCLWQLCGANLLSKRLWSFRELNRATGKTDSEIQ